MRYTIHRGLDILSYANSLPEALETASKLWDGTATITIIDHEGRDILDETDFPCWIKLAL